MSEGVSKLRPVFKLSGDSLHTWWKHLPKFLMLYVWGILHIAVPTFIFFGLFLGLRSLRWGSMLPITTGVMVLNLVMIFLAFWAVLFIIYYMTRLVIAFFLLIKNNYKGDELKIFQESRKYFWSYLFLKIILAIIILLLFLALVVPGIIFLVFYSLAIYVFFFENKRGMSAIKRSKRLVKNHWWAVAGRLLFAVVAFELFASIVLIPLHWMHLGSSMMIIWNIIARLAIYLVIPALMIFIYNLYKNLAKVYKPAK